MTKLMGAREANSLKIRSALIMACGDLLADQPIDAITISDIVDTAGVAKGSFYNHFPDKEALATTVSKAIREELERKVLESNLNVTDPAYKIARGVCTHIRLAVDSPKDAMIMLRSHEFTTTGDAPINENVAFDIAEGVESSRLSPRCADVGILLLIGTVASTMARILEKRHSRADSVALASEAITLLLCGFGVLEEEAQRIAAGSAQDIIGRESD